jgi:acyloxyacyl hydrolase
MRFFSVLAATFAATALATPGAPSLRVRTRVGARLGPSDLAEATKSAPSAGFFGGGPGGLGGGSTTMCATCTVVVGILEQIAQVDGPSRVFEKLCTRFKDEPLRKGCEFLADLFGTAIIRGLEAKERPDAVCAGIKVCTNPACHLWPTNGPPPPLAAEGGSAAAFAELEARAAKDPEVARALGSLYVSESPLQWLKDLINRFANGHSPLVDLDGDGYSTFKTMRGFDWDGRDCDDESADIHPGRAVPDASHGPAVDHNCNGISGVDASGKSFEDKYCTGTGMRTIALLGDSLGAHFELPPQWFNVTAWDHTTFDGALAHLENEFDLPWESFTTGFVGNQTNGPVYSLYEENLKRNRCNKNFRQNHGVNGERSGSMESLVKTFASNQTHDLPKTIVLELVGNDVCNGHEDTVAHMTTVETFRSNMVYNLNYLNSVLPSGSAITLVSLADGLLLYEAMHNRTHPAGFKYTDLYEWLNCLSISPCKGWLSNNATLRNATQTRANELTAVLQEIVVNTTLTGSWPNIEVAFWEFPLNNVRKFYDGPIWKLIEPVDRYAIFF